MCVLQYFITEVTFNAIQNKEDKSTTPRELYILISSSGGSDICILHFNAASEFTTTY